MSYTIVVAQPPVPEDDRAAWDALEGLVAQEGPRPSAFRELHDRLTARYPCLCSLPDDEVDDAVWSDGPLLNNFGHRAAVLAFSSARAGEVLPFVVDEANGLGLVVFDHGTGRVHRPPAAGPGSLGALVRRVLGRYSSLFSGRSGGAPTPADP